jgi:hypothetical protein
MVSHPRRPVNEAPDSEASFKHTPSSPTLRSVDFGYCICIHSQNYRLKYYFLKIGDTLWCDNYILTSRVVLGVFDGYCKIGFLGEKAMENDRAYDNVGETSESLASLE